MEEVRFQSKLFEIFSKYIFLGGLLTPPALEDMEVAVVVEAPQVATVLVAEGVVKSPDSSVGQFRPSSARLSLNAREVFINKSTGQGNDVEATGNPFPFICFEMKTLPSPVPNCKQAAVFRRAETSL